MPNCTYSTYQEPPEDDGSLPPVVDAECIASEDELAKEQPTSCMTVGSSRLWFPITPPSKEWTNGYEEGCIAGAAHAARKRFPFIMIRPGADGVLDYIPFKKFKRVKGWMDLAEPGDTITIVVPTYEE